MKLHRLTERPAPASIASMARELLVTPPVRYHVEVDPDGQRLVIPIRMAWDTVLGAAILTVLSIGFHTFRDEGLSGFWFWLTYGIAALGLAAVLTNALTSLFAREFVQIGHGQLIHGWRLFSLRRQRSYAVREIAGLTALAESEEHEKRKKQLVSPLSDFGKIGTVKFEVGTKTVHLGPTLNEGEALAVADWLARRLPRGASEV